MAPGPNHDDTQLVERVKAGSTAAFDTLARRHAARLLAMANRMLASPGEAEDAVQNALAAVWVNRHRLDAGRPVAAYLTTVVLNKCRDRLRRRKAAAFLGMGKGIEDTIAADDAPGPARAVATRQEFAAVRAEIERLPVRLREALVLVAIDGRSQREAAELLGVSEKSIETRIYRARNRLREKLGFV